MRLGKMTRTAALVEVWGDNTRRAEMRRNLARWMTPRGIRLAMRMTACDPTRCGDGAWSCPFCVAWDLLGEDVSSWETANSRPMCDCDQSGSGFSLCSYCYAEQVGGDC